MQGGKPCHRPVGRFWIVACEGTHHATAAIGATSSATPFRVCQCTLWLEFSDRTVQTRGFKAYGNHGVTSIMGWGG
ncbi:hypothetical protein Cenrod_1500 [Candidatus Symbiobacter mobilis CR]|uniref:Uncharacterized protein n=1 Tax=Candidatus Symbiobacter mobilis CR TaxID=946483 RepID=U5N7R1_9BURK|nr:hypothetical protein Cenrod_1500 [Candidatus Symbiobacter mobilis CR]